LERDQLKKLQPKSDWWENTAGLSIFFFSWLVAATEMNRDNANSPLAIFLFILASGVLYYAVYSLWTENQFFTINTQQGEKNNLKLVEKSLRELGWSFTCTSNNVVHADIRRWGTIVQSVVIVVEYKKVHINVKHEGTGTGRLPFFFGLNKKRKKQFLNKISPSNKVHNLDYSSASSTL